jgi:hypothetical protein
VGSSFEDAQRTDMESFRDYDRETWRRGHTVDAVSVLPNGTVLVGRDEIVTALDRHFSEREATWSWTELSRRIDAGRAAHILYETRYESGRHRISVHALTGVTWSLRDDEWLVVCDQGTRLH